MPRGGSPGRVLQSFSNKKEEKERFLETFKNISEILPQLIILTQHLFIIIFFVFFSESAKY
jgi:hypothetical protein